MSPLRMERRICYAQSFQLEIGPSKAVEERTRSITRPELGANP